MAGSKDNPLPEKPMDDFRRFFSRGLAALLPTLLTIALLIWAYDLIDRSLGRYITNTMVALFAAGGPPHFISAESADRQALEYGTPIDVWDAQGRRLTVEYQTINHPILSGGHADAETLKEAQKARNVALWRVAFARYKLHLIGFVIAIIVVYFLGLFLASLLGRTTWRLIERLLYRIPVVKAVYPNIKQVTDFLLSDRKLQFSGVVAVEYPRKGLWSMGLVTGPPLRTVQESVGDDLLTVFVPSSPTPVTGYVITVRRKEVLELDFTLDDAMRYSISGGVIKPPRESLEQDYADPLLKA
ncbi:MAG: DUF502 domain-containing protein [Phycisphaerae bacterium]